MRGWLTVLVHYRLYPATRKIRSARILVNRLLFSRLSPRTRSRHGQESRLGRGTTESRRYQLL